MTNSKNEVPQMNSIPFNARFNKFFSFSFNDFWANVSRGFLHLAQFTTEPTFLQFVLLAGRGSCEVAWETSWSFDGN
jgi:hypothetical protein